LYFYFILFFLFRDLFSIRPSVDYPHSFFSFSFLVKIDYLPLCEDYQETRKDDRLGSQEACIEMLGKV